MITMTPEEKREYNRKWNIAHPNYFTERSKEWSKKHPERRREQRLKAQRAYRARNPNIDREYYESNREKMLKQQKLYYEANRERILERDRDTNREYAREHLYPHRAVWEEHFKVKIPDGFVIHHKDGDRSNNNPSNLLCLDRGMHKIVHSIKIKET